MKEYKSALCCCIVCRKILSAKGYFSHYERVHLGSKKYSSGRNNSYDKLSERAREKKLELEKEYLENPAFCKECGKILPYDRRGNKFCNSSCGATFNNRIRPKKLPKEVIFFDYVCDVCGKEYSIKRKKDVSTCASCLTSIRNKQKSPYGIKKYRTATKFTFSPYKFPDKFDLTLVEQFGWYSPTNKKNNLSGVSKDHMLSVRDGFDQNVPVEHMCHPANCQLLVHSDNKAKGRQSIITYSELLERIYLWDKFYNYVITTYNE